MLRKIIPAAIAAALMVLVLPSLVSAYGACRASYTHVGPNGAYHTSETVARGPEGNTYAAGHTTAYGAGGADYRSVNTSGGSVYGVHTTTTSSPGYIYAPSAAYNRSTGYSYVR